MAKIAVRKARIRDALSIAHYKNSLLREDLLISRSKKTGVDIERKIISSKKMIEIICVDKKEVCGLCAVRRPQKGIGIVSITVAKPYREMGLGTRLLKESLLGAKRLGTGLLIAYVYGPNKSSARFLRKNRFSLVGKISKGFKKGNRRYDKMVFVRIL